MGGYGGVAPRFLNLYMRYRWMVSFAIRLLCRRGKNTGTRWLEAVWPQSGSGREKIFAVWSNEIHVSNKSHPWNYKPDLDYIWYCIYTKIVGEFNLCSYLCIIAQYSPNHSCSCRRGMSLNCGDQLFYCSPLDVTIMEPWWIDIDRGKTEKLTEKPFPVSAQHKSHMHWRWRQYAPMKRRSSTTRLHGAISQKALTFICSLLRLSNILTRIRCFHIQLVNFLIRGFPIIPATWRI
jgi:hypothetical protein